MKKSRIVNLLFIALTIIILCGITSKIYAAGSFSVSTSSNNINVGDTITVYIKGNDAYGKVDIEANDATLSATTVFLQNDTKTVTLTANKSGTITIKATPSKSYGLGDSDENPIEGSQRAIVTVKEKTQTNPGGQTGGNNGSSTGGNTGTNNGGSSKPTVTEPKFTSANKTVYATGDINLRSSWSTSSSATKVEKGTELKLTATSTNEVNGYVWYRVTYNGQTKYVARNLVTETKPEEKSNNVNLKALVIEGLELSPTFSADVTEYSAKLVNYEETSVKVTAEAEDDKSTVKIEGNEEIKLGENVISVTVTAEDGTTKVYTVTVTNEEKEALGLSSLTIKDIELKDFGPSKFSYEIEFRDLDQLEIEAIANQEGATVEIIGNENLTEIGEHIITIMVTSADGEEIATYTITANKLAVEEAKKEINMKAILISAAIAVVILVIIIILVIKYVKGNNASEIDYVYNDNLEDNEESENEIEKNTDTEAKSQQDAEEFEEEKKEDKKPTIDDLYSDYDEEPRRKRGKGRHSK